MDGRKISLGNDWNDFLIKIINTNIKQNELTEETKQYVNRNKKLLNKMEKYKKINDKGEVYYYFFSNELEDIIWILLESISAL